MHFDQWWDSQAADAFRAAHPGMSGEQFRPVWDAAISAVPAAAMLRDKGGDMRHYLIEAHGFAAMSPRGRENIATALGILDELGA